MRDSEAYHRRGLREREASALVRRVRLFGNSFSTEGGPGLSPEVEFTPRRHTYIGVNGSWPTDRRATRHDLGSRRATPELRPAPPPPPARASGWSGSTALTARRRAVRRAAWA